MIHIVRLLGRALMLSLTSAFEFQKHFREREEILSTTAGPAWIEGSFENDADL